MCQVTIERDGKAVAFVLPDGLADEAWEAIPRLANAAFRRASGEGMAEYELAKRMIENPPASFEEGAAKYAALGQVAE